MGDPLTEKYLQLANYYSAVIKLTVTPIHVTTIVFIFGLKQLHTYTNIDRVRNRWYSKNKSVFKLNNNSLVHLLSR